MTTGTKAAAVIAGLALVPLAACATSSPLGAPQQAWPAGRTFLSTSVTADGAPRELVPGTRISLSFAEADRVSANAGCNTMIGDGEISDGRLVVSELAITEMGCPGSLHDQDAWLADLLTGSPTWSLDGDELTLSSPTATVVLLDREVADPDRPLAGPRWVVDTIFERDAASSVPSDIPAVLVIDATGAFEATTGCAGGEVRGQAEVMGDQVTFAIAAENPCTDAGNALDEAVRSALRGTATYTITARSLRLMASDGYGLGLHADE